MRARDGSMHQRPFQGRAIEIGGTFNPELKRF